jgi:hypothetical protein
MTETALQQQIRKQIGRGCGVTIWRNQVGQTSYTDHTGRRRHLKYGLCVGSSDLIGIRPVLITPAHVGTTIGQFVAIEIKTDTGRLSDEQRLFIDLIRSKGGLAGVARTPEEAIELISL